MQTRTSNLRLLRIISIFAIILIIVSYAFWRSRDFVSGPQLEIFEPTNGATIHATTTVIRGKTIRSNSLRLNGNDVSIDEQGNWSETIVIFPGINVLSIEAGDRFGKHVASEITLLGAPGL